MIHTLWSQRRQVIGVLLGVLAATPVWAEEGTTAPPPDISFWGGVGAAYSGLSSSVADDANKSGYQLDLRATGSLAYPKWTFDLTGGWFYNWIKGTTDAGAKLTVRTRAGYAELFPRYRLDENLGLGLLVQADFGTDLSFSNQVGTNSSLLQAGLGAVYEPTPHNTFSTRYGLRFVTDINMSQRQIYLIQATAEFGYRRKPKPPTPAEEPEPALEIHLGKQVVYFDTNAYALKEKPLEFLKELGTLLAQNESAWGALRVTGHTDERGSYGYNLDLSERRAEAVADVIAKQGVPKSKLQSRGYSFSMPVARDKNEQSYQANRRVELRFYRVTEPGKLKDQIDAVRRKVFGESLD